MTVSEPSPEQRYNAFVSITCILGGAVCFSVGDMTMKRISETSVPLHEAVVIRSAIALVLTLLFLRQGLTVRAAFRTNRLRQHILRGFAVLLSNLTFFAALAALPIGDATAVFFVAPMLVTVMAAVFVGDQVGPVRWAALTFGFFGVLLVVQPGSPDFQWVLILPVLSALAYAAMQTYTRTMGVQESAVSLALYIQASFLVGSLSVALLLGHGRFQGLGGPAADFLLRPWVVPSVSELGLIGITGVTITAGAYLLSQAYRLSPASLVAPFEYGNLVLAVFWGVLIWGDYPDRLAGVGILLIISSGVVVAFREARAGRKRPSVARIITRR
ncbi:MAG: DMT family transporter [Pseudomonadota bacterium]